jgi:hypothetical protein
MSGDRKKSEKSTSWKKQKTSRDYGNAYSQLYLPPANAQDDLSNDWKYDASDFFDENELFQQQIEFAKFSSLKPFQEPDDGRLLQAKWTICSLDDNSTPKNTVEINLLEEIKKTVALGVQNVVPNVIGNLIIEYVAEQKVFLRSKVDKLDAVAIVAEFLCFHSPVFHMQFAIQQEKYDFETTTSVLELIAIYVHSHKMKPPNKTCKFDAWFTTACNVEHGQYRHMLLFANYLGMHDLVLLLCNKIGINVKDIHNMSDPHRHPILLWPNPHVNPQPQCDCSSH